MDCLENKQNNIKKKFKEKFLKKVLDLIWCTSKVGEISLSPQIVLYVQYQNTYTHMLTNSAHSNMILPDSVAPEVEYHTLDRFP